MKASYLFSFLLTNIQDKRYANEGLCNPIRCWNKIGALKPSRKLCLGFLWDQIGKLLTIYIQLTINFLPQGLNAIN
jgi:hypothetical protein